MIGTDLTLVPSIIKKRKIHKVKTKKIKTVTIINWKEFYKNGGYSNENSDPLFYSKEIEEEYFVFENDPEYYDEDDQE